MVFNKELLMERKYAVIGGVLAFILVSWLCWYFSDRQVIKRQLVGMTWDMRKESRQESTVETALKMREVKAVLAADCTLVIPERGSRKESIDRDMAIIYLMSYRDRFTLLEPSFTDMRIDFPAKGEAAVRVTVLLKRQADQAAPEERTAPAELLLKKEDGTWLLHQAVVSETLL